MLPAPADGLDCGLGLLTPPAGGSALRAGLTGVFEDALDRGSLAADFLVGETGFLTLGAAFARGSLAADFLVGFTIVLFDATFAADFVEDFATSFLVFAATLFSAALSVESAELLLDLLRKGLSFPTLFILLRLSLSLTFLSCASASF